MTSVIICCELRSLEWLMRMEARREKRIRNWKLCLCVFLSLAWGRVGVAACTRWIPACLAFFPLFLKCIVGRETSSGFQTNIGKRDPANAQRRQRSVESGARCQIQFRERLRSDWSVWSREREKGRFKTLFVLDPSCYHVFHEST